MSPDQMNPQEFLELTYARARQSVLSRRAVLGGFAALAAAMVLPDRAAFAEGRGGTLRIGRDQEPDSWIRKRRSSPSRTRPTTGSTSRWRVSTPTAMSCPGWPNGGT
ncbi:hypothetical protein [Mesorhizobium amorphae]|uniref:hypothetical protein n=1 Tax=Mesorhizobium amorphae TaxID=71433 RepID=UPI00164352FB|nr:hypothetical protein [Mesorhizobium amorphae]